MTTASYPLRVDLVTFDPLRDKTYQSTRLGRSVVDFLAWKKLGGAADRTLDQYERDLARGCLMFPTKGIKQISDGDMLHIAASFQDGERRTRVAAWQAFYRWALKTRKVSVNPCDVLPEMRQSKRTVHDIFTEPEIIALCGLPIRDGALMQILFDAGLRKGDARRLTLGDLRATGLREELVILDGKGGKDRVVPATTTLAARVNELVILEGLNDGDHLWYAMPPLKRHGKVPQHDHRLRRDRPVADGTFHRWWERCIAKAGVRYRNPHMTRHTFATRYLRMGGKSELLQEALGHASIATTVDLYVHMDKRDLHDEFERIFD